ncbi:uncharacterized protein LOC142399521 [Odontesthes bonariensis]|uniref:uncharacterized protein LOC142399521 n=1 Tax=Odontesthes bonariensis TaxID=219752 RepID=UPI003F58189D
MCDSAGNVQAPVLGCQTAHIWTALPSLWRNNDSVTKVPRRCSGEPKCRGRREMEESYETFEEELWPPKAEPLPQKPARQIRRPEMYASRTTREEVAPGPQQPRSEPKTSPREPSFTKTTSLRKAFSIQNLTQIETPWENVTLNRCLLVAITILVLTSGFQRLNETFRGRGATEEEEEAALITRKPGTLRHRGRPLEPETSLWEVMFSWLPNLDDDEEEDDDDDEEIKRGKSKKGVTTRALRGVRNRPLQDKKLLKQKDGKLKDKRAREEQIKGKKKGVKKGNPEEEADKEDEGEEEEVPKKNKKPEEKKERKKAKKG